MRQCQIQRLQTISIVSATLAMALVCGFTSAVAQSVPGASDRQFEKEIRRAIGKAERGNDAPPVTRGLSGPREVPEAVRSTNQLVAAVASLTQQVKRCWSVEAGSKPPAVTVEFKLSRDGRLDGAPRVLNSGTGAAFDAASGRAIQAVDACQPYTNLPQDSYTNGWDRVRMRFDPANPF